MEHQTHSNSSTKKATLGGGCFWCLEAIYEQLVGVESVVSGYSGGSSAHPSYHDVSSGMTGHAEVVQITYNPDLITYRDLLAIFFTIHDPTTLNRQGNDIGTQYRSVILYHNEEQKKIAEDTIKSLKAENRWPNPIVTEITPFDAFYPAEDYHQSYYRNNQYQPYCQIVITPKIAKFRKKFLDKLTA